VKPLDWPSSAHRRWIQREELRVADARQGPGGALGDRGGAARLARAHIPGRERDGSAAGILAGAGLALTDDREDDGNVLFLVVEEIVFDLLHRGHGARLGGAGRQRELQLCAPLVFNRQESWSAAPGTRRRVSARTPGRRECHTAVVEHAHDTRAVSIRHAFEPVLEAIADAMHDRGHMSAPRDHFRGRGLQQGRGQRCESTNATTTESNIARHGDGELGGRCSPTEPPKKAIGRNTRRQHSAIAINAVWISCIDRNRGIVRGDAGFLAHDALDVLHHDDGVVHQQADGQHHANKVRVLMVNPHTASTPNVPNNTTGTAIAGISVARQLCRNTNITITTSRMASASVLTTSSIESFTKSVLSSGNA